jgi:cytochrome P450 family 6
VLPILDRVAGTDYVIPGTNITIEKGTTVYVPLLGLHMDPDMFPDPDHFDPERFSKENRRTRHPFTYLPFGEGPKYCIGRHYFLVLYSVAMNCKGSGMKLMWPYLKSCPITGQCRSDVSCGQFQDKWSLG